MRILLLAHAFNGLTQRLWCALGELGHELSLELDISDDVTREAIAVYAPDVVIAPFLRRALPADVWRRVPCLVVHPGPPGDRGPAALDWAILERRERWGVTVLQADAEFDGGVVHASATFPMRDASKASLYRDEVATTAVGAVLEAVACMGTGRAPPSDVPAPVRDVGWRRALSQQDRTIDWLRQDTAEVLRQLRAGDSAPGVRDDILGVAAFLYDAYRGPLIAGARPGEWVCRAPGALLRATHDGSVWIGHARRDEPRAFKLPVRLACPEAATLAELASQSDTVRASVPEPIAYREQGAVGYLRFAFYNGAMATDDCRRLLAAIAAAAARPTRVLVLEGGREFWSNGIHLNVIEAAASPADESWRNIEAIDDVAEAIVRMAGKLTVAAVGGNAGAGGAFLALAADRVWVRPGVVLNLHYRNMGNLYGSELWTYTLPRRVGAGAQALMRARQPLLGSQALARGLADAAFGISFEEFAAEVSLRADALATSADFDQQLAERAARRAADEVHRPLASYREEEMAEMRRSFYGFDTSYHVARHRFVHKAPHSWTPRHLARHRDPAPR
jgi:putative two-component system hydrogenase maturation factor HypX/HoxX